MTTPPSGSRIITRQSDGAGYLFNDSRSVHEGVEECDILCCPHYQQTINLQAWRKDRETGGGIMGGWCRQCSAPTCPTCTTRMQRFGCEPFMKQVEAALENAYRVKQNLKVIVS